LFFFIVGQFSSQERKKYQKNMSRRISSFCAWGSKNSEPTGAGAAAAKQHETY
jgi:hypothetical protein